MKTERAILFLATVVMFITVNFCLLYMLCCFRPQINLSNYLLSYW